MSTVKNHIKVTKDHLEILVQQQIQSLMQASSLVSIQEELDTRLQMAEFENRRLRERLRTLQKKVAELENLRGPEKIETYSQREDVGDKVLNENLETECARQKSSNKDKNIGSLVVGGWGFKILDTETDNQAVISNSSNLNLTPPGNLPPSLTVSPVKRSPASAAYCSPSTVIFTSKEAFPSRCCSSTSSSEFLTPVSTSVQNKSGVERPFKRPSGQIILSRSSQGLPPTTSHHKPDDDVSRQLFGPEPSPEKIYSTHANKSICQECISSKKNSSCTTSCVSPVHLRKISVNQGKVAISWNVVKNAEGFASETSVISGYELYQASPVNMWQLVGTFAALKLPVVVVMSSCKQQTRYQIRLKILFKNGGFVFSNILSFIA